MAWRGSLSKVARFLLQLLESGFNSNSAVAVFIGLVKGELNSVIND